MCVARLKAVPMVFASIELDLTTEISVLKFSRTALRYNSAFLQKTRPSVFFSRTPTPTTTLRV
jgi:hypothetical protein